MSGSVENLDIERDVSEGGRCLDIKTHSRVVQGDLVVGES